MHTLLNYLGILLGMSLLMVFVWGACRHVVHQVITRYPRLAEATPQAKTQKYALASVQVLWNILVPVCEVMVGFLIAASERDVESANNETRWYDGCLWYRGVGGVWYSHSPDEDTTPPSYYS